MALQVLVYKLSHLSYLFFMTPLLMFDFDGTLIDTGPDIVAAVNEFLAIKKAPALPEETIINYIGRGLAELVQAIAPETAADLLQLKTIEREFLDVYDRHVLNNPRPLRDAVEFLRDCPYQIAVVSNKRERFIPKILDHLGLMDLPWVALIGGDSLQHKKPHPMPLLTAMAKAGVSSENAYMVGDGFPDVGGAKACQIPCVAVDFGYGPIEELMQAGATYRIRYFSELHQILAK
ncbi:MAG: HAD hydrolase-like protein [Bdellovibrionaceae bacterium]|nr:HAD hydrolase-like protein [Bdellovibrionales bacterium]MCB9086352.1 HAD hydrolase-like protein [Pseudobdellovibrionaceae bacterium]